MLFKNLDLIVCTLAWQPNRFKILFTSRIPAALAPLLSMRTLSGIPFEDSALAKNLVAAGPCLCPVKLGHYFGREGGTRDGSEAILGRRHSEAAA